MRYSTTEMQVLPLSFRVERIGSPLHVDVGASHSVVGANKGSQVREGKESIQSLPRFPTRPDDSMVRGSGKAELQRLGHVISDFQFDKTWPANVILEKLLSAFSTSVPSLAEITCKP